MIEGPVTASATVGRPFRLQLAVRNAPAAFSAQNLPAGLQLDDATGAIAGVPTTSGAHAVVLTTANTAGTSTAELALIVDAAAD